jgi:hypothetical protein
LWHRTQEGPATELYCGIDPHSNNPFMTVMGGAHRRVYERRWCGGLAKTQSVNLANCPIDNPLPGFSPGHLHPPGPSGAYYCSSGLTIGVIAESVSMNLAKRLVAVALVALPSVLLAEDGRLKLPDLSALAAKASDHTDVSLNGDLLGLAGHFMDGQNSGDAQAQKLLAGIKDIEIHSYKFTADNAYSSSDVDQLRRQLQSPEWKRLVQTHSAQEREDVDIFMSTDGKRVNGIAIIAAEPRELTVINLVGTLDLKEVAKLGGQMGIPKQIAQAADSGSKTAAD